MGFNWVCKAGKEQLEDVEASQPLKGDGFKEARQFKGPWYAVLGDGTAPDVAAGCLAFWVPSIAFGWNSSRAFGSKWWKEALKFFLLTSVVWCLIRVTVAVLLTTQCPPAPMGGALVGGPMMGPQADSAQASMYAMLATRTDQEERKPCKFKGGKGYDDQNLLESVWHSVKSLVDDDGDDDNDADHKDKEKHHKHKHDKHEKHDKHMHHKHNEKEDKESMDVEVGPSADYDEGPGNNVEYMDAFLGSNGDREDKDDNDENGKEDKEDKDAKEGKEDKVDKDEKEDKDKEEEQEGAASSMATAIAVADSKEAATQTSSITNSQPMTELTAATSTPTPAAAAKPASTLDAAMASLDPSHPVQLSLVNTPQGLRMVDSAGHYYNLANPEKHEWRAERPDAHLDRCFARIGPIACVLMALAITSTITALMYAAKRRTELRGRFGIPGTIKEDAALWLCCAPCALAQETRTMMHHQVEEGMWQGARDPTAAPPHAAMA